MKPQKILLGIVAIILVTTVSCKKDDDDGFQELSEIEENINERPSSAVLTLPEKNKELVSLSPLLQWEAAVDPESQEIKYDLFFGTDEGNLPLLISGLANTEHQIETELQKGTSYYWNVVAKDSENGSSESGISSFKTQYVSENLITDNAPFSKRNRATVTVFKDRIWLIGGRDEEGNALSDIWSSADGNTWALITDTAAFGSRHSHATIVFNGKMWIYNGNEGGILNNEIWSSEDGINWIQEENDTLFNTLPFYGQSSNTMFVFNDMVWRLAAYDGSIGDLTTERYIWNSSDGKNWTLVSENHGFDTKYGMSVVEFNGKLYGFEGYTTESGNFNKVWESVDGIIWTLLNDELPFGYDFSSEAVIYDGKLFITAGAEYNELWFTENGTDWTKAVEDRSYPTRHANSSIVFDNKIFIVAGGTFTSAYNDVWVLE